MHQVLLSTQFPQLGFLHHLLESATLLVQEILLEVLAVLSYFVGEFFLTLPQQIK
jgi:hypothetical protein